MINRILWIFVVAILFVLSGCEKTKEPELPVYDLVKRLIPERAEDFNFEELPSTENKDVFETESKKGNIIIRGNNGVSMSRGLNHYLKNYCNASTSWCGENLNLPFPLPVLNEKIRVESPFKYRYYLNYCTHSYTMAFWDWERWEKEIDWMALNGINLPLAITGQGKVWQNTMNRLGFEDEEVLNFLPGPAFEAWWLMGNLEGWGGPVPQSYIDNRAELQKKIVNRMRELGIQPVLQGFFGMVPNSSISNFPGADIRDPGKWNGYRRPAFLNPTDPMFEKIAKVFYEEQRKLYGDNIYFAGDPFHEGGQTAGIDVTKAASEIHRIMNENNPGPSKWVLQAWQDNPRKELLAGIPKGEAVVLDLWAETRPQWGGVKSSWKREEGFLGHDWVWSIIPNFGGNTGMYGKLGIIAHDVPEAYNHSKGKEMSGVGAAMEGIEVYPVVFDFIYDMAWNTGRVNTHDWATRYAQYRYGVSNPNAEKAWQILQKSVYNSPRSNGSEGCPESILCARPAMTINSVSTWGSSHIYYQPEELVAAIEELLEARDHFKSIDTYQYDIVDVVRQLVSIRGQELHSGLMAAFKKKDRKAYDRISNKFLQLIRDQDQLLSTRKEFMLGRWVNMARNLGATKQEKDFYEWNARTQITTWGDRTAADDGRLHEYAHREWAGLLKDFYLPRWEIFINNQKEILKGNEVEPFDWYSWEEKWTKKHNIFSAVPENDPVGTALTMFEKYK